METADSVKHPSTFLIIKRRRTTSKGRDKWKTSNHKDVHRAVSPRMGIVYGNNQKMHNALRNRLLIEPCVRIRRELIFSTLGGRVKGGNVP